MAILPFADTEKKIKGFFLVLGSIFHTEMMSKLENLFKRKVIRANDKIIDNLVRLMVLSVPPL